MGIYSHQITGPVLSFILLSVLSGCGGGGGNAEPVQSDQSRFVIGNDGPEGDSGFTVNTIRYPLDAAIGDIWGERDDRFRIDFTLTNGNFRLEPIVVDGQSHQVLVPAKATAVLHAEMYSPGSSFGYGGYAFVPSDDVAEVSSGVGYFTDAYVGVDTNMDGMVEDDERYAVIEGVVEFEGSIPFIELNFSMTLSDGQSVTGEYTGLFDFTER